MSQRKLARQFGTTPERGQWLDLNEFARDYVQPNNIMSAKKYYRFQWNLGV